MTLKADKNGFLIGEGKIHFGDREKSELTKIREQITVIGKFLMGRGAAHSAGHDPNPAIAVPRTRAPKVDYREPFIATPHRAQPEGTKALLKAFDRAQGIATPGKTAYSPAVTPARGNNQARDSAGRFIGADDKPMPVQNKRDSKQAIATISRFLGNGVGRAIQSGGNIDATMQAAGELRGVTSFATRAMSTVATPVKAMFGRGKANDQPVTWYKRIFNQLRNNNKQDTAFHKAELKAIRESKGGVVSGGGGGSWLMDILPFLVPIAAIAGTLFKPFKNLFKNLFGGGDSETDNNEPGFFDALSGHIGKEWNSFVFTVNKGVEDITNSFVSAKDTIVSKISGAWDKVTGAVSDFGDRADAAVGRVISSAKSSYEAASKTPVIGPVYKAVANGLGYLQEVRKSYGVGEKTVSREKAIAPNAGTGTPTATPTPTPAPGATPAPDATGKGKKKKRSDVIRERFDSIKGKIVDYASKMGVDPGPAVKMMYKESAFDPSAKTPFGSAHGLGQFTDATWLGTLQKHGEKFGIPNAKNLTMEQAKALRNNVDLQIQAYLVFTDDNTKIGKKIGGDNPDGNTYSLAFLGGGDASKFFKAMRQNPDTPFRDALLQGSTNPKDIAHVNRVISGNRIYAPEGATVGQVYKNVSQAVNDKTGNAYADEARRMVQAKRLATNPMLAPSMPVVSAGVPASIPAIPSIPIPKVPDIQNQPVSVSGPDDKPKVVVINNKPLAGQDLPNRRIAHIVTGGLSGRGY